MAEERTRERSYVEPPKSQLPWIQGFKEYVEKRFGSCNFKEVRYIRPDTPIYDSVVGMELRLGKLKEDEELGGCCGRLPTGEIVIYLVNNHKLGYNLPFHGLLYELIHLAKPEWSPKEVEQETLKHLNSAKEYADIFIYNSTHKRKRPYRMPKQV